MHDQQTQTAEPRLSRRAPQPPSRMIRFCKFWRGNCARSTATAWVKAGKLKTFKVGGSTYVSETFPEFIVRQAAERDSGE